MAVAKGVIPSDFQHDFVELGPSPSLLEEISRRAPNAEHFSEACVLDSAFGIADAMAALQASGVVHPGLSTNILTFSGDFIKLTPSKVQQADRFKSPLDLKKFTYL